MGCRLNTSTYGVLLCIELTTHLTAWGLFSCVYFMSSCVYLWACMYHGEHGRSEGNFLELGLPFHHIGPGAQLRFARGLFPLSHLDGPQFSKLWLIHTCETIAPIKMWAYPSPQVCHACYKPSFLSSAHPTPGQPLICLLSGSLHMFAFPGFIHR